MSTYWSCLVLLVLDWWQRNITRFKDTALTGIIPSTYLQASYRKCISKFCGRISEYHLRFFMVIKWIDQYICMNQCNTMAEQCHTTSNSNHIQCCDVSWQRALWVHVLKTTTNSKHSLYHRCYIYKNYRWKSENYEQRTSWNITLLQCIKLNRNVIWSTVLLN